MNKSLLLGFCLFFLALAPFVSAENWTIEGDSVYMNDTQGLINVTPHTPTFDRDVEAWIGTHGFTGDLTVGFGFDVEDMQPSNLRRWVVDSYNMTVPADENSSAFNVTVDNSTWLSVGASPSVLYYNYSSSSKWYYYQNVPFVAGELRKFKFYLDITEGTSGKYEVIVYPSSYGTNIGQAISDGNFYILDPWWNSSSLQPFDYANQYIVDVTNDWGDDTEFWGHIELNSSMVNVSNMTSTLTDFFVSVRNETSKAWHPIEWVITENTTTNVWVTFYDNYTGEIPNGSSVRYAFNYGGSYSGSGTAREFSTTHAPLEVYYPFDTSETRDYSGNNRDLTETGSCSLSTTNPVFGDSIYCPIGSYLKTAATYSLSGKDDSIIAYSSINTDRNDASGTFEVSYGDHSNDAHSLSIVTTNNYLNGNIVYDYVLMSNTYRGNDAILGGYDLTDHYWKMGFNNDNYVTSAVNGTYDVNTTTGGDTNNWGSYSGKFMINRHEWSSGSSGRSSIAGYYDEVYHFVDYLPSNHTAFSDMFYSSYNQSIYVSTAAVDTISYDLKVELTINVTDADQHQLVKINSSDMNVSAWDSSGYDVVFLNSDEDTVLVFNRSLLNTSGDSLFYINSSEVSFGNNTIWVYYKNNSPVKDYSVPIDIVTIFEADTPETSQYFTTSTVTEDATGSNTLSQNSGTNTVDAVQVEKDGENVWTAWYDCVGTVDGSSNTGANPNGNYPYLYKTGAIIGTSTQITVGGWMYNFTEPIDGGGLGSSGSSGLWYERDNSYGLTEIYYYNWSQDAKRWRWHYRTQTDPADVNYTLVPSHNTTEFVNGEWVHWVATYDSTSENLKLYINGDLADTGSQVYATSGGASSTRIGGQRSYASNCYYGYMHDVRGWAGYNMTAEEVAEWYAGKNYDTPEASFGAEMDSQESSFLSLTVPTNTSAIYTDVDATFNSTYNETESNSGNITMQFFVNDVSVYNESWTNQAVGTEISGTLGSGNYSARDEIKVIVNATSRNHTGNNTGYANVTGYAPTITTPTGTINSNVDASIGTLYSDTDSDAGNLTFYWNVNDVNVYNDTVNNTASGTTAYGTLAESYYAFGDVVNVTVEAYDIDGYAVNKSAEFTVGDAVVTSFPDNSLPLYQNDGAYRLLYTWTPTITPVQVNEFTFNITSFGSYYAYVYFVFTYDDASTWVSPVRYTSSETTVSYTDVPDDTSLNVTSVAMYGYTDGPFFGYAYFTSINATSLYEDWLPHDTYSNTTSGVVGGTLPITEFNGADTVFASCYIDDGVDNSTYMNSSTETAEYYHPYVSTAVWNDTRVDSSDSVQLQCTGGSGVSDTKWYVDFFKNGVYNSSQVESTLYNSSETVNFTAPTLTADDSWVGQCLASEVVSSTDVVDSYTEGNYSTIVYLDDGFSDTDRAAQSFTGDGTYLNSMTFEVTRVSGPLGNLTAVLYAHSGTYGTSSVATGSELARATNNINLTTVSTSPTRDLLVFNFDDYLLSSGTYYVAVLEWNNKTENGGRVGVSVDATSPTHSGNRITGTSWNDGWSADSTRDVIFYVNGTTYTYTNSTPVNSSSLSVFTDYGDSSAYYQDDVAANRTYEYDTVLNLSVECYTEVDNVTVFSALDGGRGQSQQCSGSAGNVTFLVNVTDNYESFSTDTIARDFSLNDEWCLQMSPNVSTSCGGLDTGNFADTLTEPNTIDGDWDTYYNKSSGTSYVFTQNFTVPANAKNTTIYMIKYALDASDTPVYENVSIFEEQPTCWDWIFNESNPDYGMLELKTYISPVTLEQIATFCHEAPGNGVSFFQSNTTTNPTYYEDAVIWNMRSYFTFANTGLWFNLTQSYDDNYTTYAYLVPQTSDWYSSNYYYKKDVTINVTDGDVNPFFIVNSSVIDMTLVDDTGYDIVFVKSDDATLVNYNRESFDKDGDSKFWIKASDVSTGDNVFWLYYGNNTPVSDLSTTW